MGLVLLLIAVAEGGGRGWGGGGVAGVGGSREWGRVSGLLFQIGSSCRACLTLRDLGSHATFLSTLSHSYSSRHAGY